MTILSLLLCEKLFFALHLNLRQKSDISEGDDLFFCSLLCFRPKIMAILAPSPHKCFHNSSTGFIAYLLIVNHHTVLPIAQAQSFENGPRHVVYALNLYVLAYVTIA